MKHNLVRWSQRYVTALRQHLKPGPRANLQPALGLGHRAVALGLETLEMARIHARALSILKLSNNDGLLKRAEAFFAKANTAIEETHRTSRQSQARLGRLEETLSQRTQALAVADRQLQRTIVRRKAMENTFKKRWQDQTKCLEESLQLQNLLRQLTHRVLVAQEDERKTISCGLQDEIAQALLGINVRLLTLKAEARTNTKGLKNQIASAQRLVAKSAKSVRQFARKLDLRQQSLSDRPITAIQGDGAERPACADIANMILKPKSDSKYLPKEAHAACETIPASLAGSSFPVIAMAASVGGLKALSVILGGLPADFPAAVTIVMHLAPGHKSLLVEILKCRTPLAVKQAHPGDILCPSSVFVAPPNHHMSVVEGDRLELSSSASEKVHHARPSAEPLFASVAEFYQKNAIAVVLTGGDGDGSTGVQIIKAMGGKVIAQDRPTSEDFSMPETSIRTGDVDFILPVEEIAPKLIELVGAGNGQDNDRTIANEKPPRRPGKTRVAIRSGIIETRIPLTNRKRSRNI